MLMFPDPGLPRFLLLRRRRAVAARAATASTSTSSGSSPRSAASSRPTPVLPIPSNAHWLPLASFIQAPFIAVMGATAIASALPMVLIGSLAAPLTWAIARDIGVVADGPAGRRRPVGHPGGRGRVHGPARELRDLPAARRRHAVARRPRPSRRHPRIRRGRAARRPRVDRPQRRVPARGGGRPRVRHRPRASLAARHVPAHLPFAAAVGCLALYLLIVVPVVVSPARGLRLDLADGLDRDSALAPSTTASGTASPPTSPSRTSSPRARPASSAAASAGWSSAAANFALIVGSFLLVPFMVWGAWRAAALGRLLPWFLLRRDPVRRRDDRLPAPRPGRRVHPLGGRARAVRLHPGAGGRRCPRRWHRPTAPGVGPGARDAALLVVRSSASSSRAAFLFAPVVQAGWRAERDTAARARRGARPAGRPGDRPAHVDRRGRLQVLDGPRRRRLAGRPASTRSATSPRPTTSAGWSSSVAGRSRRCAPVLDRDERPGLDRRRRLRRSRRPTVAGPTLALYPGLLRRPVTRAAGRRP